MQTHFMVDQFKHSRMRPTLISGQPGLLLCCRYVGRLWLTLLLTHYELNETMPNEGMFPANVIGDMLNTTGSVLCYKYE